MNVRPRHWSIRGQAILFTLLLCAGAMLFTWLAAKVDPLFELLAFLVGGVFVWLRNGLRCPKCRKPVYKLQAKVWWARFTFSGGTRKEGLLFPRTCSRCGADLTRPIEKLARTG